MCGWGSPDCCSSVCVCVCDCVGVWGVIVSEEGSVWVDSLDCCCKVCE